MQSSYTMSPYNVTFTVDLRVINFIKSLPKEIKSNGVLVSYIY